VSIAKRPPKEATDSISIFGCLSMIFTPARNPVGHQVKPNRRDAVKESDRNNSTSLGGKT